MGHNHWTIFKEGNIRIILTKFGQNPASSLGGDSFEAIVDDAGHTLHVGHPTIKVAHREPMAQVS